MSYKEHQFVKDLLLFVGVRYDKDGMQSEPLNLSKSKHKTRTGLFGIYLYI